MKWALALDIPLTSPTTSTANAGDARLHFSFDSGSLYTSNTSIYASSTGENYFQVRLLVKHLGFGNEDSEDSDSIACSFCGSYLVIIYLRCQAAKRIIILLETT